MHSISLKRITSLVLAVALAFSLIPFSVSASETDDQRTSQTNNTESIAEMAPISISAVTDIQSRIDAVLTLYGITTEMTDAEIANAIIAVDGDTIKYTMDEMDAIDTDASMLTQEELLVLELDLYERFRNTFDLLFVATPAVEVTGVSGVTVTCDSNGSISESSGTVTATVTGSFTTRKTTVITVTNTSGSTATISFEYSASNYDTSESGGFTLSDSASGTYSVNLTNGTSLTFNLRSKRLTTSTTATVTLSNFAVATADTEHNVALTYDSSNGGVTMDGTTVSSGTYSVSSATFVAIPNSGALFLGWIDPDSGAIVSSETTYNVVATEDMKLQAVFAGNSTSATNTAWFLAGGTHLFNDLEKAATYTSSASTKTVVLMNNGTLPAGNYTIPSSVTLLIPFDSSNTLYTTEPYTEANLNESVSVYRTMTMASDANITVNGAISLSAHQAAAMGNNGAPCGALSMIKMESSSSITVNSGANLYCWGYIYGSGSVLIKDGGTVYEDFIIRDWRGGNATSGMIKNEQKVFPISQYYIQNIEVPMTLEAGATEMVSTSVSVSLAITSIKQTALCVFIGETEGLFQLTSGAVTKDYIEASDRMQYTLHSREVNGETEYGVVTMGALDISMDSYSLNSADYTLPLTSNISVLIESGSNVTVTQDFAFLPGFELEIEELAKVTISSGYKLYAYDAEQWGNYCYSTNVNMVTIGYAPGKVYTRTSANLVDAKILVNGTLDVSAGSLYTTNSGANICSTGSGQVITTAGTETVTYQVTQTGNEISAWNEIPITPAKLKNADGSYVQSATNTYTYDSTAGAWRCAEGTHTDTNTVDGKCDVCGYIMCEHANLNTLSAVTATCIATGLTEGKQCADCGTITVAQTEVAKDANNHTNIADVATVEKTCTTDGYTAGKQCTDCGVYTEGHEVIASTGHTAGADATCTTAQTCTVCNAEMTAKLGHSMETIAAVSATCATAGNNAYFHCTRCDQYFTDSAGTTETTVADQIIPATGNHTWDAGTVTTAATCTVAGVQTFTCSVCGDTKTEAISATGHSYNSVVAAPTCLVAGYTTHTCSVCGDTYTDSETAATGHTAGAAATCTTAQTCTVCNAELVAATGHIDANTDHTCDNGCGVYQGTHADSNTDADHVCDYGCGVTLEDCSGGTATCTDKATCSVCGNEHGELDTNNHAWDNACDTTCNNNCGETREITHSYESVVTDPTCTAAGYTTYTCSCGDSYVADETAALGHTEVVDAAVAATCTTTGLTEGKYCSVCNEVLVAQTEVAALGHSYEAVVTAPTCTEGGYTTYTCACGDSYVDSYVDALDHDYELTDSKAATCTEDGYVIYTCKNDASHTYTETLSAAGTHNYSSVVTTEPGCETEGVRTYTCAGCGNSYTESIAANSHSYTSEVTAPTCNAGGYTTYICSDCGDTYTADETAATGEHTYVDGVCTGCDATTIHVTISTYNMELGNSLAMIFWVDRSTMKSDTEYEAVITRFYADGTSETVISPMSEWESTDGFYKIKYANFAAKEMTDDISIQIRTADGTIASKKITTSIRLYAMFMIDYFKANTSYREFVTAMVDMLNYGAAAQKQFEHDLNDLADAQLTEEQQALATQSVTPQYTWSSPEGTATTCNLELISNIVLHIWYKDVTSDMYAVVSYTNHYGDLVEDTVTFDEFTSRGDGVYSVPIDELVVADGTQVVTCTMYNVDGTVYGTCTQSVESYVYVMLYYNLDAAGLYNATMKFVTSSYNYFH